jgi:hypothetical protein
MIPGILRPDISFIYEKSMAGLHRVETNRWRDNYLDPKDGFAVFISCTEDVVLRSLTGFCSIVPEARVMVSADFCLVELSAWRTGRYAPDPEGKTGQFELCGR